MFRIPNHLGDDFLERHIRPSVSQIRSDILLLAQQRRQGGGERSFEESDFRIEVDREKTEFRAVQDCRDVLCRDKCVGSSLCREW